MTIIAALKQPDHILIAADSFSFSAMAESKFEDATKLWQLRNLPIVWGFYGPEKAGNLLAVWLDDEIDQLSGPTWATFDKFISEKVIELRALLIERAARSGNQLEDQHLCQFLFAGYLAGQPGLLMVQATGDTVFQPELAVLASSGGTNALRAAQEMLRLERGARFEMNADTLSLIMRAVCRVVLGTGEPIQMWKITRETAERL